MYTNFITINGRGDRVCNTNELLRLGFPLATTQKRFFFHCFQYYSHTISGQRRKEGKRPEINWREKSNNIPYI